MEKRKNLAELRTKFTQNKETMSIIELKNAIELCTGINELFAEWPKEDKKSIAPFLLLMNSFKREVDTEIARRWNIIGEQKSSYDELKKMFEQDPLMLNKEDLQIFYYLIEERMEFAKNITSDGIPKYAVDQFQQILSELLENIELEISKR